MSKIILILYEITILWHSDNCMYFRALFGCSFLSVWLSREVSYSELKSHSSRWNLIISLESIPRKLMNQSLLNTRNRRYQFWSSSEILWAWVLLLYLWIVSILKWHYLLLTYLLSQRDWQEHIYYLFNIYFIIIIILYSFLLNLNYIINIYLWTK